MKYTITRRLAAILALISVTGCDGKRQAGVTEGMLSDSAPPGVAMDSAPSGRHAPVPFPVEAVSSESAGISPGMIEDLEDSVAPRPREGGRADKPAPMPKELKPGRGAR